jgi:hypothetical protein
VVLSVVWSGQQRGERQKSFLTQTRSLRNLYLGAFDAETSITAIYNMAQNNIPFQFWGQWPEARANFSPIR